jgi:hypothetical protein
MVSINQFNKKNFIISLFALTFFVRQGRGNRHIRGPAKFAVQNFTEEDADIPRFRPNVEEASKMAETSDQRVNGFIQKI